ncbi:MAG: lytic murein transglycosylase [bacterium]
MQMSRRAMLAGLSASGLVACGSVRSGGSKPNPTTYAPVQDAGYDRWLADFRPRAAKAGISDQTLNSAFTHSGFLPDVIEKDRNQLEFSLSLEDYLAITCSADRVNAGKAVLRQYGPLLTEIEAKCGVDAHVVAAIWGVESFYGTKRGNVPVIAALSTLAYEGRRASFFEGQLFAALKILQHGDVEPDQMTGGWAGAMGHTQFIPTTYLAYAVDFRGDGRRDIWSDDPTDALASAASYLSHSGWSHGQPWGMEVQIPSGFNRALAGHSSPRGTADWAGMGVRAAGGGRLTDHGSSSLLLPAGATGPAFLIYRNYTVITHYNASEKYVIGVGHLSDRIKGGPPLITPFPPDAYGLRQQDRIALQQQLTRMGYDTGSTDGVFGPVTRSAIEGYQQSRGLPVTGTPSLELLTMMR